ncbi:MAG: hypothetical protein CVV21_05145 [Candidatus Goldiibacteriota bacterium HGW-Goldbacteria-1]|jgi:hypothetical protein|nr:MAG: hypothetical protein CVV21_05145 [Candidatus Goldiibacteriota bacterium HGW-Goldbacteria-1]
MKKILFNLLFCSFFIGCIYADNTAGNVISKIYSNFDSINTIDVEISSASEETILSNNHKELKNKIKRIVLKKENKKKKLELLDSTSTIKFSVVKNNEISSASLYPACLFDIKNFLNDYNLTSVNKDERIEEIKGKEIIAIKNNQQKEYPQIRMNIIKDKIVEMRFYSFSGKKYYVLKMNKYVKIKGIDIPEEIVEEFHANKNEVINTMTFKVNRLNTSILDTEFNN